MSINLVRTNKYYGLDKTNEKDFVLPYNFVFPKVQRAVQKLGLRFINYNALYKKRIWREIPNGKSRFLIRVDDFPRWDLNSYEYLEFHEIMKEYNVPYIIGVTPFLSFNEDKYTQISEEDINIIKQHNLKIAVHGFNHYNYCDEGHTTELSVYSDEVLEKLILKTKDFFSSNGISMPRTFIPPYNAMNYSNYKVLSKYFNIITGGPLTLNTMPEAKYLMGVFLEDSLYLPSYYPFYGTSREVIYGLRKKTFNSKSIIIPITLHWAWEKRDHYKKLRELLTLIKDEVISWDEIEG
ncbi:DUF2334 domain-containing protein [Clostridium sp.]|uniref:DUF2334 domain-containing protein n=1 Tax=Clostridium sp. TaxID=1506 RepID=UPI003D6C94F1